MGQGKIVYIVPYGDVYDPSLPCCCHETFAITGVKIKALKKWKWLRTRFCQPLAKLRLNNRPLSFLRPFRKVHLKVQWFPHRICLQLRLFHEKISWKSRISGDLKFTYHNKQTSHSSRVLISYFHLSQKLKTLNHVSRNSPFTPLIASRGWGRKSHISSFWSQ